MSGTPNSALKLAMTCAVAMVAVGAVLPQRLLSRAAAIFSMSASVRPDGGLPAASQARLSGGASVLLLADSSGHFHADAEIEGRIIPMLVDTGATFVALRAEDADAVGLRPMPSDYKLRLATANGVTTGAPVRIREVHVGGVVARDIPAVVMRPGVLAQSLLGMSFLQAVGQVEFGSRQLVLKQ